MADVKQQTNRIKMWNMNRVTCQLCADEIGWAMGFPEVWCDACAKQVEDATEMAAEQD